MRFHDFYCLILDTLLYHLMLNTKFLENILRTVLHLRDVITQFLKQNGSRSYYLSFFFFFKRMSMIYCHMQNSYRNFCLVLHSCFTCFCYLQIYTKCFQKISLLLTTCLVDILSDGCKIL